MKESIYLLLALFTFVTSDNRLTISKPVGSEADLSDGDVVDVKKIDAQKLMANFKVNFEGDLSGKNNTGFNKNINGTTMLSPNGTWIQTGFNGTMINKPLNATEIAKKSADEDKKFKNLVNQVFGGGKSKKKRYDKNGREITFYKDNSIPIMLRKVIPPRGSPLPMLHFEYVENGSTCRCSCKL